MLLIMSQLDFLKNKILDVKISKDKEADRDVIIEQINIYIKLIQNYLIYEDLQESNELNRNKFEKIGYNEELINKYSKEQIVKDSSKLIIYLQKEIESL